VCRALWRRKKRRKQFSLHKKKILEEIHRGMKKCDVARKYGISSSTLSTFLKDREN
jgi:transposase-like protein